jgi:hypothetical protein
VGRIRRDRVLVIAGALAAMIAAGAVFGSRARATRTPLPPPPPAPAATLSPFSVPLEVLPPAADLPPRTLRVLVLGDSVASFLGLALRYRQEEARAFVAARGVGECSIFEPTKAPAPGEAAVTTSCSASWATDAAEIHPDVTLIVLGGAFLNDRACDPPWQERYAGRLEALGDVIRASAGRVVVARVPYPIGRWRHSNVLERVDCFDDMLARAAVASRWDTLDLMEHVCPTRACIAESGGQPIRPDGLHFDSVGAEETARWTLAELNRLAAR